MRFSSIFCSFNDLYHQTTQTANKLRIYLLCYYTRVILKNQLFCYFSAIVYYSIFFLILQILIKTYTHSCTSFVFYIKLWYNVMYKDWKGVFKMTRGRICSMHEFCTDCPDRKPCTMRLLFYSNEKYVQACKKSLTFAIRLESIGFSGILTSVIISIILMDKRRKKELELYPTYSVN